MSPIKDRDQFARTKARDLFPEATVNQVEEIVDSFRDGFYSGYSPDPNEWEDGERGVGSGATGEEYVAYLGESLTDLQPDETKMNPDDYCRARHKCLTM